MSHRSSHSCVTQLSVVCDNCQYSNGTLYNTISITIQIGAGIRGSSANTMQGEVRRIWATDKGRGLTSPHVTCSLLHPSCYNVTCTSRTHTAIMYYSQPILLQCYMYLSHPSCYMYLSAVVQSVHSVPPVPSLFTGSLVASTSTRLSSALSTPIPKNKLCESDKCLVRVLC